MPQSLVGVGIEQRTSRLGSIYSKERVSYQYVNREERMDIPDVRAAYRPPVPQRVFCGRDFDCLTAARSNRSTRLHLVIGAPSVSWMNGTPLRCQSTTQERTRGFTLICQCP